LISPARYAAAFAAIRHDFAAAFHAFATVASSIFDADSLLFSPYLIAFHSSFSIYFLLLLFSSAMLLYFTLLLIFLLPPFRL